MPSYTVTWEICIEYVDSPREAAEIALEIQRSPESTAQAFSVKDIHTGETHEIDLWKD